MDLSLFKHSVEAPMEYLILPLSSTLQEPLGAWF